MPSVMQAVTAPQTAEENGGCVQSKEPDVRRKLPFSGALSGAPGAEHQVIGPRQGLGRYGTGQVTMPLV